MAPLFAGLELVRSPIRRARCGRQGVDRTASLELIVNDWLVEGGAGITEFSSVVDVILSSCAGRALIIVKCVDRPYSISRGVAESHRTALPLLQVVPVEEAGKVGRVRKC
jgi:hypothetical protein